MKPRRQLINISRFLGKVPSLGYALMYLALIPVFATIYYSLPRHFYHSTLQLESTMEEDTSSLLRALSRVYYDRYEEEHRLQGRLEGWNSVKVRDWWVMPRNIENLKIDNNEASIHLTVNVSSDSKPGTVLALLVRFSLTQEPGLSFPVNRPEEEDKRLTIQGFPNNGEFADEQLQHELLQVLFPCSPKNSSSVYLGVPIWLMHALRNFSGVTKGQGSEMSGNYVRMLYLSAVTITTLGFGDIVPITTAARVLVSVESVLGIVLIGLFLNALSYERGQLDAGESKTM